MYGLGATLYRLLAGQAPHQASDSTSSLYAKLLRITHEACPGIATRCPELSPGLVVVVDRMVALDPAQRFATASDVADALAPFAESSELPALLARVPRLELQESQEHLAPPPRPIRRRKFNRLAPLPAFAGRARRLERPGFPERQEIPAALGEDGKPFGERRL